MLIQAVHGMILRVGHKGLRLAFEGERVTLRDSGMKIMRLKYPLHKLLYFITVAAILLPQQIISQTQSPSQSPTQPSANSSAANTTKPYTAKANCTSNGTYVNSKGQTVKRPELARDRQRERRRSVWMEPTASARADEERVRIMAVSPSGFEKNSQSEIETPKSRCSESGVQFGIHRNKNHGTRVLNG